MLRFFVHTALDDEIEIILAGMRVRGNNERGVRENTRAAMRRESEGMSSLNSTRCFTYIAVWLGEISVKHP